MPDEDGRKGGSSYTGKYDVETKTARPKSVGPHHARHEQEDPSEPGIRPEAGYANEIAEINAAADKGARTAKGPVQIGVKGGAEDEDAEPRPEAPGEGGGSRTSSGSMPDA
jgi:hypothetical protein